MSVSSSYLEITMGNLQELTDKQLIELVATGDEQAFPVLWIRHAPWLQAIAKSFSFNDEDVDDLVQETLVRIHRGASQYTPRSSFQSWAKQIARNVGIDYMRRRARNAKWTVEKDGFYWDYPDMRYAPEYLLDSKLLRNELREAVGSLPENQRLIIIMRYFGAMNMKDIAWTMRVPLGTVKSRLHTAMLKIKNHLKNQNRLTEETDD
jgi:RNA polymerase sigma factor (sigma-70 family)